MDSLKGESLWGLRDYLHVLRVHKWTLVLPLVIVPLIAVFVSLQQQRLYQASAEVYLTRQTQSLASVLSGLPDMAAFEDAERLVQTQVNLARVPLVARRVLEETGVRGRTTNDFLENSTVTPKANVDILVFSVRDPSPELATALATSYARAYTRFRRQLNTDAFEQTRREIDRRLSALRANGRTDSETYADLERKRDQLRTVEALQTANALVVREASDAKQVQPRPVRNGVLGAALGLLLGLGLAYLWHALDTRIRSVDEVARRLQLPLVGRVPVLPRRLRRRRGLAMVTDPHSAHAEAYRVLRTNLEFANIDLGARMIMVTSAVRDEGKTTTTLNLAIAIARAGRRVLVVELDLRRPAFAEFLDFEEAEGVTDVVVGRADLESAVRRFALGGSEADDRSNGRQASAGGALEILPAGTLPFDPGEFVSTRAVAEYLEQLKEHADVVLVDAPPLLGIGDAVALSGRVDAMLVVTRLSLLRRPTLNELKRVLDGCPATKLGLIVIEAARERGYGYGYYTYSSREARRQEPVA